MIKMLTLLPLITMTTKVHLIMLLEKKKLIPLLWIKNTSMTTMMSKFNYCILCSIIVDGYLHFSAYMIEPLMITGAQNEAHAQ